MNTFLQQLRTQLDAYIEKLQSEPRFMALQAEVALTASAEGKDLKITDNAGMWLSGSYTMAKSIADFVKAEYKKSDIEGTVEVIITFSRKERTMEKPNTTATSKSKEKPQPGGDMEQAVFATEKPKYKLADVVLPQETLDSIKEAISTIESFDLVYNQWNFKSKEPSAKTNICFFGAPGTGKTMCAHAIADSLGKEILIASYSDIQSQYVGVGPKNLKAVFDKAEEKNALLFFDEADSFLRKRTSDNSSSASMHYNSMTNEMMKHLEDFNGIVIFATNLTENTDEAFKTRISFSIEFKVPDEECRAKIIRGMIPKEVPLESDFTEEDYKEMSQSCDGFVGRDIRNSVKTTLSVGAQNKEYPFTKQQFVEGFKKYKDSKSSFDKSSGSDKKKGNPMDIYTANGCIHNLLAYAAWVDGKETELESEYLKMFAKILSRNKLVINSVSDLPEFEEICHEITDEDLKKKVMRYFAYFMANTDQTDSLYEELSDKLAKSLALDEAFVSGINTYYTKLKEFTIENAAYKL